jgi:hypothetical protein
VTLGFFEPGLPRSEPGSTSEGGIIVQEAPRKRQSTIPTVLPVLSLLAGLAVLLLTDYEAPWIWIVLIIQALVLIVLIVNLRRLVRSQRDDYWKERGRDPRHPDRPM